MDLPTKVIPIELSDGTIVRIEAVALGEQKVAFNSKPFKEVTSAIKAISKDIAETLKEINEAVQPNKVSVKLGLEVAVESGQLTALIVKGASKANLEITMEWGK